MPTGEKKFKQLARIITGGITGAVALVGISIFLVLLVGGAGTALPAIGGTIEKWTKEWTLEGIYNVFVATGIIGFLLGAIAGWRHSQIIRKWFSSALILGTPMIFCLWLFYGYASHVEIPQKIKLADCTNSVTNIHFKVPKGHDYFIQMDVPGMQQMPNGTVISSYKFSGNIHISDGTAMIADFPISSEKAWSISSGFVITGISPQNTNAPSLNQFIKAQKNYDLKIELNPPPPPSSSIWLHWLQAYKDKNEN